MNRYLPITGPYGQPWRRFSSGRTTTTRVLARPDNLCADHAVVEAPIPDGFFAALGCRGEEQAAAREEPIAGATRTTRDDPTRWQPMLAGPPGLA